MSTGPHISLGCVAVLLIACGACGGPTQPARTETVAVPGAPLDGGAPTLAPLAPDAGPPQAAAPPDAEGTDAGSRVSLVGTQRTCGCKLCAPVVSDDACKVDADCAAATPCHATACIAASKVPQTAMRPMCTRIMKCNTTDANACTCYQGKCALTPGP